jgi:uroporphyrinogen III methyltransferase/synthase
MKTKKSKGFVCLAGAGPGDPGLLTLAAKNALETCDAIIYDYLVNPKILEFAPHAEKIYVGKQGGKSGPTPQKSIELLLLKWAKKGKRVVRLKGGDPFIFGRGGEEALFLAHHKIPFEIIPGITAGIAAPAYAGIPATHRGLASEVTFLTAHEDPAKKGSDINWGPISRLKGTLVIYMGINTLPDITKTLILNGKDPRTFVSVVEWGTLARQRVVSGTLESIARDVKKEGIVAPAIVIIGKVNSFREKLNWFERKPLFGKTILVTRSRTQVSNLSRLLEKEGAQVIELPTIQISPARNFEQLDQAISDIQHYDWLVFTSENGVEVFFSRLAKLGKDVRWLAPVKIAAIGPATKEKINLFGIEPDLMPQEFSSEGLVGKFPKKAVEGKRFLLVRTNIAPDFLKDKLEMRGGTVREISVYRTEIPKNLRKNIAQVFRGSKIDYVTFTSSSTAGNFFKHFPKAKKLNARIFSIGPVTSKTIRQYGYSVYRAAKIYTIPGLVETILETRTK